MDLYRSLGRAGGAHPAVGGAARPCAQRQRDAAPSRWEAGEAVAVDVEATSEDEPGASGARALPGGA